MPLRTRFPDPRLLMAAVLYPALILALILVVAWLFAAAPAHAEPLPASIRAFEAVKDRIPPMELHGLSLCKLLARRPAHNAPFFALPSDIGEDTCDLSKTILAYAGWCTAGVEDPTGPHFSTSMMPSVHIVDYDEGTVVFLNHVYKAAVKRTYAGESAATVFFLALPATLDIRAPGLPLFPKEYLGQLPPRKEPCHDAHC